MKNFSLLRHELANHDFTKVAFDELHESQAFMMGSQWHVKVSPKAAINVESGEKIYDREDQESTIVSFNESDPYGHESIGMQKLREISEQHGNDLVETPTNNIGGGAIEGAGPNDQPPGPHTRFAGCDVFRIDSTTFCECAKGVKNPHDRWENIVNLNTSTGKAIREYSYNNPGKSIIVQNEQDGTMVYVKKGRGKK